jgi:hypothetical protein
MTKNELLAEIGRRFGDTSASFRDDVLAGSLDFVLADLASWGCINLLRKAASFAVTLDTRDYPTRTALGILTPNYPLDVLQLTVYAWGPSYGRVPRLSDREFEAQRLVDGEDARGKWIGWRFWPNESNIQVHPPADSDAVTGATCEALYLAPPTILAGGDAIEEIRFEHLECLVFGIKARLASFDEATAADATADWQNYIVQRRRMWGNRVNNVVVRQIDATPYG